MLRGWLSRPALRCGAATPQRRRLPAPGNLVPSRPVSVLGAWRNSFGQQGLDVLFTNLETQFSNCTSYRFELLTSDVVGGMAVKRSPVLRVTQVCCPEECRQKVAHRHADTMAE